MNQYKRQVEIALKCAAAGNWDHAVECVRVLRRSAKSYRAERYLDNVLTHLSQWKYDYLDGHGEGAAIAAKAIKGDIDPI